MTWFLHVPRRVIKTTYRTSSLVHIYWTSVRLWGVRLWKQATGCSPCCWLHIFKCWAERAPTSYATYSKYTFDDVIFEFVSLNSLFLVCDASTYNHLMYKQSCISFLISLRGRHLVYFGKSHRINHCLLLDSWLKNCNSDSGSVTRALPNARGGMCAITWSTQPNITIYRRGGKRAETKTTTPKKKTTLKLKCPL